MASKSFTDKRYRTGLFGRSLLRMLLLGFIAVSLLLVMLGVQLYRTAWVDAWSEVQDKHQVLAVNLAGALTNYIQDRRHSLATIADSLGKEGLLPAGLPAGQKSLLDTFQRGIEGMRSLSLLDAQGRLLYTSNTSVLPAAEQALADGSVFFTVLAGGRDYLSGVASSPFDDEPSLMLGQPVRDVGGQVVAVLLGELSVAPIDVLRRQVRFGKDGHAVVVDQFGRVLSHPNEAWTHEMRDLSALPIVQLMLAGLSGVTEFHAPFGDRDMVAGYTKVPGLGWGVMVPQPKQEIAERVRTIVYRQLLMTLLGLALVALMAYLLAAWVSRPLQRAITDITVKRDRP